MTPSNMTKDKDNEKDVLILYRGIGKILFIFCILLFISLIFPYYEGDYYDSSGSDFPFHKETYYNGFWAISNALNDYLNDFLVLMVPGVFFLICGSVYNYISRRKLFRQENQVSMLGTMQKSLIMILISGVLIFISLTLILIIGFPLSIDPDDPLDFAYIINSDSIFMIYERIAYGFYMTFLISLVIVIICIVEIYLGYRHTVSETVED